MGKTHEKFEWWDQTKVSAAVAFLFDPEILILDEPTAGLDPLSSELLKEKYNEKKLRES